MERRPERAAGPDAKVAVVEQYRDWSPRLPAKRIVERLLAETPKRFLVGLSQVTLTNSQALNHHRRRAKVPWKGRKVRVSTALGLYHRSWQGLPAHIEIFVDNIEASVARVPLIALRLPLLSDFVFGSTLFHELGHHIHETQKPEHREREAVAEYWSRRLGRSYLQRRHPVLVCSYRWIARLVRSVRRVHRGDALKRPVSIPGSAATSKSSSSQS